MGGRFILRYGPGCVAIGMIWCSVIAHVSTQSEQPPRAEKSAKAGAAPSVPSAAKFRMPDGKPDLQGRWDYATVTPWERPAGTPLLLNEKEARELEEKLTKAVDFDGPTRGANSPYNQFWFDQGSRLVRVNGAAHRSLIVDPPDGRLPPLTADARKKLDAIRKVQDNAGRAEEFPTVIRCIIGFNTGPPLTPGTYGNNVEIIQNGDYVVMVAEHVHSARVFPVDGRPHTGIRRWLGDSVGHWEADTLVVDTIDFLNATGVTDPNLHGNGNGPRTHLVERFKRLDANTLLYSFTIDDPDLWTKPWTMEFTFVKNDKAPVLEYACHETNYALPHSLSGNSAAADKRRGSGAAKDR